jgi:hypothetical protein
MEDARRSGMDPQSLANLRETLDAPSSPAADDEFGFEGVWPANVAIVEAFLAVSTQFRVTSIGGGGFAGMGGALIEPVKPLAMGLDYSAVRVCLDALGVAVTPDLWRGLQVMEVAACAALNESKD